jgi:Tfp pilus assembly protein PilV
MFIPINLDDRVTAAAVAATGTVIGALIQLRAAWRNELSARARGVPVTKKSRRGPVTAVILLLVAAGVGGFALSQYLTRRSDLESEAVRTQMQAQLAQLSATAQRLERASQNDHASATPAAGEAHGSEDVTVTATVGPCRLRVTDAPTACAEQEAVRATLCASVPPSASVGATDLYARPANSAQPWTESRVAVGQEVGRARFADKPTERTDPGGAKQVCAGFSTWDAEQAYSARLVVTYAPAAPAVAAPVPASRVVSQASVAPISEAAR